MESRAGGQRTADNRYAVSQASVDSADYARVAEERFSTNHPYAGFWRRAAAYLIDYILVTFSIALLGGLLAGILGGLMPLAMAVGAWLYYALMESSDQQATVGKRALGLKVTDLEGNRISFGRATGRGLAHLLSVMTLGIGFAMVVFTSRRQSLHDKVAGTLVVRREWTEEEIAAAGSAPPVPAWASVLVVLAVVLFGPFGIGMLAAISIPAYQEYTVRAQVVEGLRDAESYKAAVADAVARGRTLAEVDDSALDAAAPRSKFVASVRVEHGAIVINYGAAANRLIAGKELALVPGLSAQQQLVWVCGHATPPAGLALSTASYSGMTSIPDKYLPRACRAPR